MPRKKRRRRRSRRLLDAITAVVARREETGKGYEEREESSGISNDFLLVVLSWRYFTMWKKNEHCLGFMIFSISLFRFNKYLNKVTKHKYIRKIKIMDANPILIRVL